MDTRPDTGLPSHLLDASDSKLQASQAIGEYLDCAGEKYLDSINDIRPESLETIMDRLAPLKASADSNGYFASIGIGQGEEIHALRELFPNKSTRILGIDISQTALMRVRERIANNFLDIELLSANATSLPFKEKSMNGIVFSAIFHEIYSYHRDGIGAVALSLREVDRVLTDNGSIFIRDFIAPDANPDIIFECKNNLAVKFYEFFREKFRKFESPSWGSTGNEIRTANQLPTDFFPLLDKESRSVRISLHKAGELMLHFRNFWSDMQKGTASFNCRSWKEADEVYYLPLSKDLESGLNAEEYTDNILKYLNGFEMVSRTISTRQQTNKFLARHFDLSIPQNEDMKNIQLISQTTRKIDLVLKKCQNK